MPRFSFIIPVYNRPDEVDELLDSLRQQEIRDFEVIIVEDGSERDCEKVVADYASDFELHYSKIPNGGPGPARNHGAAKAQGEWLIFLDSDTLIPVDYLKSVEVFLDKQKIHAFGGADRDRADFLPIQKAISYSMTSFLTTGGIRGSEKSLEKFKPRSFNMGIRKEVFDSLKGFRKIRYGEDIDFSLRIEASNYQTAYIPGAFVYHKRRTSFHAFFYQIMQSGKARIRLSKLHPGSFKLVHLFPAAFSVGMVLSLLVVLFLPFLPWIGLGVYCVYFFAILVDSLLKSRSLHVSMLSVIASFVQLFAYGYGFIKEGVFALFSR